MNNERSLDVLLIDMYEASYFGVESYLQRKLKINIQHLDNFEKFNLYISSLNKYDLFIIDVRPSGSNYEDLNGFDIIYTIRKLRPNAKIIVYTLCEGIWHIKRMRALEVNALVHKKNSLEDLHQAIIHVLQGDTYVCRDFRVFSTPNNTLNPDSHLLSIKLNSMEVMIVRYAALGLTSRQIAEKANRSVNTVMDYRKKLFVKFDVNSMEELLTKALRNGFPLRNNKSLIGLKV